MRIREGNLSKFVIDELYEIDKDPIEESSGKSKFVNKGEVDSQELVWGAISGLVNYITEDVIMPESILKMENAWNIVDLSNTKIAL